MEERLISIFAVLEERIDFCLLTGLLIVYVYCLVKYDLLKKLRKWIDKNKEIKQVLIILFLFLSPFIILFIYDFIQANSSDATDSIIPVQIQAVIISAVISWLLTSRRNKTQLVFDLHNEFNPKEMYEARNKADIFLATVAPDINLKDLYDEQQSPDQIQNVLLVVRFYERLWVAIDKDQLKKEFVPELFGELFYWWFIYCFKKRLLVSGVDWHAKDKIKELKDWMDSNTKPSERQTWIELAKKDQGNRKSQQIKNYSESFLLF